MSTNTHLYIGAFPRLSTAPHFDPVCPMMAPCSITCQAMASTCYTACAILVDLPAAKDRKVPPALERFLGEDAEIKDVGAGPENVKNVE